MITIQLTYKQLQAVIKESIIIREILNIEKLDPVKEFVDEWCKKHDVYTSLAINQNKNVSRLTLIKDLRDKLGLLLSEAKKICLDRFPLS